MHNTTVYLKWKRPKPMIDRNPADLSESAYWRIPVLLTDSISKEFV